MLHTLFFFFFQAEDGIRDLTVTGVQTCALPISRLGLVGLSLLLAGLAAGNATERANQANERPAVRTRVALRRSLLIPAGPAHHAVVFFELGLFHSRKIALVKGSFRCSTASAPVSCCWRRLATRSAACWEQHGGGLRRGHTPRPVFFLLKLFPSTCRGPAT